MAIDLHIHSNISDGEYTPERLIRMAKDAGLTAVAVADHDTVEGSKRALQEGEKVGVLVVPAIEISASLEGQVVHVLGYGLDLDNQKLAEVLHDVVGYRFERAKSIIANINTELTTEQKQLVNIQEVLNLGKEKPLTRVDIAVYLVKEGYAESRSEAFEKWLEKYNVPNKDLSIEEAIDLVHSAGGIAVLAHPNSPTLSLTTISTDFKDQQKVLLKLQTHGLDGIEVLRFKQSPEDEKKFLEFARSADMLVTGGTDFHGPGYAGSAPAIGANDVPDSVLDKLLSAIEIRRAKNPS